MEDWLRSSVVNSLDGLYGAASTEVDEMVSRMDLTNADEAAFRAEVAALQEMPTTVEGWLGGLGLVTQLSAVESFFKASVNGTLEGLETLAPSAIPGAVGAMGLDASQEAQFRAALSALQAAAPGSVNATSIEEWLVLPDSGLQGIDSAALEAYLVGAAGELKSIQGLSAASLEELVSSLGFGDATAEAEFRFAVAELQSAPATISDWMNTVGLSGNVTSYSAQLEGYLVEKATSIAGIHDLSAAALGDLLASAGLDVRAKAVLNSAIEALDDPARVFGGAFNSTIDLVDDLMNSTAIEFLKNIDSFLCNFQDDQVCDEPLRCPYLTDTNDCDREALAENVMDAYVAAVRKSSPDLAEVAAALSDNYHDSCPRIQPIEKCGGCVGTSTPQSCTPGGVGYQTPEQLCRAVQAAERLYDAQVFCAKDNFWKTGVNFFVSNPRTSSSPRPHLILTSSSP